jgi:hypothetical protein
MIHINGTSAKDLTDGYLKAFRAASNFLEALNGCSPNGRDYYPLSEGAIFQAVKEHTERKAVVRGVMMELKELMIHCNNEDKG